jgi:tRNA-2-methylthio-N6-dimethylallyladenosine synthase
MNRGHSRADYLRAIERLRMAQPKLAFTSDFIVGFPAESDAEFEETISLIHEVGYVSAYSFKYSPRPGTPAADMAEQISEDVKSERLARLQQLVDRQQDAFQESCIGRRFEILFEKPGRKEGQIVGRSPYLQPVQVLAPAALIGDLAEVMITATGSNSLYGDLVRFAGEARGIAADMVTAGA